MTTDKKEVSSKKKLGLYLHIPFCRQKCLYCDFCSLAGADGEFIDAYCLALLEKISEDAKLCREYEVDTVYIGGGTPTVLPSRTLAQLLERCFSEFSVSDNAEISCECNPATASKEYFGDIRVTGFNRLSIGLQSVHQNELTALGRIHSYSDFLRTFEDARTAGFDNISADLMYGIPEQTLKSFERSIDELIKLSPEHISSYCLKVEPSTPFGKMGSSLVLPDEDEQYEMYMLLSELLSANGYEKYEISNFSREGKHSRHNMRYWLGEEYLGIGTAVHSYFGGERFFETANISSFASGVSERSESERIEGEEILREYVMLRMRLAKGIDSIEFEERFGKDFLSAFPSVKRYVGSGHVLCDGRRYAFSDKGFFVSSYILSEMLDFT